MKRVTVRSVMVLALASVMMSGCAGASGPLPSRFAQPDVVLDAYLRALLAGDCVAARTLATETFTNGNGELCGALRVTAIGPVLAPARPGPDELVYSMTLRTSGGDSSVPDGDHTWFYQLKRQPNGTWRLSGGGSGP